MKNLNKFISIIGLAAAGFAIPTAAQAQNVKNGSVMLAMTSFAAATAIPEGKINNEDAAEKGNHHEMNKDISCNNQCKCCAPKKADCKEEACNTDNEKSSNHPSSS